jgi:hypothetical protein
MPNLRLADVKAYLEALAAESSDDEALRQGLAYVLFSGSRDRPELNDFLPGRPDHPALKHAAGVAATFTTPSRDGFRL